MVAIYGTVAAIAAELWRPRSVVAPLGRGFFAMLQGAWLVQIARIMWGGESSLIWLRQMNSEAAQQP